MRTVRLDDIDLSRHAERVGGWLGPLPRDPSADPPDMAGCRLPRLTRPDEPKEREE